MKLAILLNALLVIALCGLVTGSKILMLMPMGSRSHFSVFEQMALALGAKGHKVTVIGVYAVSKTSPNVESYALGVPDVMASEEQQKKIFTPSDEHHILQFSKFAGSIATACDTMYEHPKVKTLLEEIKAKGKIYDLVLANGFMNECSFPLASMAAKHIMLVLSMPIPQWVAYRFNVPFPVATIPGLMSESWPPLNFLERLKGTVGAIMFNAFFSYYLIPTLQSSPSKYLPEGSPTIEEAMNKVCFILANGDDVFTVPQPSMPYLDNIGGFHLKKPKPLPKEFEDFMASSGEHGVVVFALGSFVQGKYLPAHVRDGFITAFGKLKQKVLWKFEEQFEGMPENVKIVKWMPQQDILGHPKTRLFISHGGRFSLQEATYHGVPIIGLPLFADHPFNIGVVKRKGFGEELDIKNITTENVYSTISKVLNEKSYAENAKKMSSLYKDKITHPLERGVYWAEYILRHNGAPHLKNRGAEELNLFQYLLMDVFAVLAITLGLGLIILFSVIRFVFRFFTKKQKKQGKDKKMK